MTHQMQDLLWAWSSFSLSSGVLWMFPCCHPRANENVSKQNKWLVDFPLCLISIDCSETYKGRSQQIQEQTGKTEIRCEFRWVPKKLCSLSARFDYARFESLTEASLRFQVFCGATLSGRVIASLLFVTSQKMWTFTRCLVSISGLSTTRYPGFMMPPM